MARMLGITKQTVQSWKTGKSHVPWRRLKKLVYDQSLNWDWLLEGDLPKTAVEGTVSETFDWSGINTRFLGLFPDQRQHVIAKQLEVAQETVSKINRNVAHVPWAKLWYAKHHFNVTWHWLLEGE